MSGVIMMSDFAKASWAKYMARMPQFKAENNWMMSTSQQDFRQELRDFCASVATTPRVDHGDEIVQEVD
jgi:hypothetical protein